jgi:hypothetical protein
LKWHLLMLKRFEYRSVHSFFEIFYSLWTFWLRVEVLGWLQHSFFFGLACSYSLNLFEGGPRQFLVLFSTFFSFSKFSFLHQLLVWQPVEDRLKRIRNFLLRSRVPSRHRHHRRLHPEVFCLQNNPEIFISKKYFHQKFKILLLHL